MLPSTGVTWNSDTVFVVSVRISRFLQTKHHHLRRRFTQRPKRGIFKAILELHKRGGLGTEVPQQGPGAEDR